MKHLKNYFLLFVIALFAACTTTSTKDIATTKAPAIMEKTAPNIKALPLLKGRQILLTYGGWQGHKPKEYTDKIAVLLRERGATVTISPSVAVYEDSVFMSNIDLLIQSVTMDKISKQQLNGLLTAVKNGMGFAGCHGGVGDSFRAATEYQYMVGGQFISHPGGQVDHSVQITAPYDAITKDITSFPIHSEQYYMHVDPNVNVLATTTFSGEHNEWIEGATIPVAWKKYFGNGRIFYFSIGHNIELFDTIPEARTILMRGFQWAGGSKYEPKEAWLKPVYSK